MTSKKMEWAVRLKRMANENYTYLWISFYAVQVISICVYMYNQLFALFHYVFKFLTP